MTSYDPDKPFIVGLTGGIASGKSTVADMFAELGVPIIDTDLIAREVVRPGQPALDEIRDRFGNDIIESSGDLDRSAMRRLIFARDEARLELESILHPRIGDEVRRQSAAADGPYQVIAVPLLVGSPLLQLLDRVLVVDCEEEMQIRRLMARDGDDIEQVRRILAAQASRDDRLAIADDVIENNGTLNRLSREVIRLDQKYRHLALRRDRDAQ